MTHTHDELLARLDALAQRYPTDEYGNAATLIREQAAQLETSNTRIRQFQFCIDRVAEALGNVCCGGVDSSPEDQLSDPHSTTRVLCDAVKELKDSLESEIDAHNFTRIQLFDSRKAREEWERGIRYHDGKNAYWENRAEAAEQDRDAFRELLAIHNLGGMTDFNIGPMKRALAAEQRLAAVFERTRERAAKVCEQTGHGAGECPEMANYCAENVRALQPEGEESAAAQENAKDQMSAQLPDGNVTPASAAALIPGLERTVRALGSNPICLRCGNTTDPWTCKIIPGDGVICLDCCRKENTEIERMK